MEYSNSICQHFDHELLDSWLYKNDAQAQQKEQFQNQYYIQSEHRNMNQGTHNFYIYVQQIYGFVTAEKTDSES